MYIVVRQDVPAGLTTAQAVHAAFEFAHQHPELTARWIEQSNFLVIVSVPTEVDLYDVVSRAHAAGIVRHAVREPDLNDEITAVALAPGELARRLCSQMPLALREVAMT